MTIHPFCVENSGGGFLHLLHEENDMLYVISSKQLLYYLVKQQTDRMLSYGLAFWFFTSFTWSPLQRIRINS